MNPMENFHIAGNFPPDHYIALQAFQNSTGQTQSQFLRAAIALCLKKSKMVTERSRLNALEEKVRQRRIRAKAYAKLETLSQVAFQAMVLFSQISKEDSPS